MATIAIGDVHGNVRALDNLLAKIRLESGTGDTVVFLGDYIDRGPDTKGCLESILNFSSMSKARVVHLMGNHEQWLLRTYNDYHQHSWILGMEAFPTIQSYSIEAAKQLNEMIDTRGKDLILRRAPLPYELFFDMVPPEHITFLKRLQPYCRTPDAVFVHGGLDPEGGPIEAQTSDQLIWGGIGFPDAYRGEERVVYGHHHNPLIDSYGWPHPRIRSGTYGLDTIAHGILTAIRLPDETVFQSARF